MKQLGWVIIEDALTGEEVFAASTSRMSLLFQALADSGNISKMGGYEKVPVSLLIGCLRSALVWLEKQPIRGRKREYGVAAEIIQDTIESLETTTSPLCAF